ncbi:MAG: hypothetical protein Q4G62_12485, partial [Pseudomonadota bacterium]|nr:hypothetical protein [Pseudomonadota bacterium]
KEAILSTFTWSENPGAGHQRLRAKAVVLVPPMLSSPHARPAHQCPGTVAPDLQTSVGQFLGHPARAIRAAMKIMDTAYEVNLIQKRLIDLRRSAPPRVIAAAGIVHQRAHLPDWRRLPQFLDHLFR